MQIVGTMRLQCGQETRKLCSVKLSDIEHMLAANDDNNNAVLQSQFIGKNGPTVRIVEHNQQLQQLRPKCSLTITEVPLA